MEVFRSELEEIRSEPVRRLVGLALEELSGNGKSFFKSAASKTGRHHPQCSNCKGGLIRHTKRAVAIGLHLARGMAFTGDQRDIVVASLILHDIQKDDYRHHAEAAVDYLGKVLTKHPELVEQIGMESILKISGCIGHHMGPWTHPAIKKPIVCYSQEELITYASDYLSSCKDIGTGQDECDLSSLEEFWT